MSVIYVSPTGSPAGAGTKSSPIDLATAVTQALPGDEVLLRGGTYTFSIKGAVGDSSIDGANFAGKGVKRFTCTGTPTNRIVFKSYPGELAVFNGAIHVWGSGGYIDFRNLEIKSTPTTRSFANKAAVDIPAIYITSPGVRFINCYIHDLSEMDVYGTGGHTTHGCIVGLNGWYTVDTGTNRAYDIYTHNDAGGAVAIEKNCFLPSFGSYAVHGNSFANNMKDYSIRYNVAINGSMLLWSFTGEMSGNVMNYNYLFANDPLAPAFLLRIEGDGANLNTLNAEIKYNYTYSTAVAGYPLRVYNMRNVDVQYNTFVRGGNARVLNYDRHPNVISEVFNNNQYYTGPGGGLNNSWYWEDTATALTWAQWLATSGFDAASTRTDTLPVSNHIEIIDNDFEEGRGFIVVYNYEGLSDITVDISGLSLTHTKTYLLRNCLNYGEYITFVYDSSDPNLTFPMSVATWTQRTPTAYDSPISWYSTPIPDFGIFLVEELIEAELPTPSGGRSATCNVYDYKEFTKYESPDGEVYNFDVKNDRFLVSEVGWGMPPISYITQRSPLQHGETLIDYRLNPRIIQIIHRRNGKNRSEYFSNRANILNLLRPNRNEYYGKTMPPVIAPGRLVKVLPDGKSYAVDVMIEQGPEFAARDTERWDEWSFTETLRFIAHDPVLYDITQKSHTFTLAQDNQLIFPFYFPIAFDLDYIEVVENLTTLGNWKTFPIIEVTGPASGFTIENQTTRESIVYNALVSEDEIITIDLRFGRKTVKNDSYVNKIGAINSLSDLATFHLAPDPEAPGGVNACRIYVAGGNATTALTIRWYDRYLGI